jgi:phosphate transport system substrate-binding protein
MNTNESNPKGSIICGSCSYDANPKGSKYCLKCGKPLVNAAVPIKERITKSTMLVSGLSLAAIALLLSSLGGYFFWQQAQSPVVVSDQKASSPNNAADIQSYNSMKDVPQVPEGTFNFGGSLIFASLVAQGTHKAINQAHPDFLLRYTDPIDSQPGTGKGIEMLLNGQLSFALSGRPLNNTEYQQATERNFKLDQVAVAIDGIGCYTHPDISIPGLSVAQLQDIYIGKITNWKEVGGPNLPIIPFSINVKTTALLTTLLGSKIGDLSPKVRSSRDYTVLVRDVASTPGAIGIGAAMLVATQRTVRPVALAANDSNQYVPVLIDGQLNIKAFQNSTYPITRYLYVIIRRDGRADEQAGVAYSNLLLTKEGQQFVQKAGLVPIR